MMILGIETSCDETSIALLHDNNVVANQVYTQAIHSHYGGVVPEIASRAHVQKIDRLCETVLKELNISLAAIDLITVTDSPGLAGALLVGISFALGIHCGFSIPIIGVNHLEGHIASVTLENPQLHFPFLALVVSGGHTAIYRVDDFGSYSCLGQTIDDAAGEAFDKVGKLLGFPYPAGRAIEQEANKNSSQEPLSFPIARLCTQGIDFSFSGLKTAVKYFVEDHPKEYITENISRICDAFQTAVINSLTQNVAIAVKKTNITQIACVGGVACNNTLRKSLRSNFGERNVFFPAPSFCTDNAAMIAKAGKENYLRGIRRIPTMNPSGAL